MRHELLVALVIACSSEPAPSPPPSRPPAPVTAAPRDAATPDASADLRTRNPTLADVIDRRVAQSSPKMKLTPDQARRVERAVLAVIDRPAFAALADVMPRSSVELARAVDERGVSLDELDRIAAYLAHVVSIVQPERLATFDDNHSHVTGRDWPEIDYTGEHMTWQGQRDAWRPKGVESFKRASFIHAYFVGAEKLAHWAKVYRPRGRMSDVTAP